MNLRFDLPKNIFGEEIVKRKRFLKAVLHDHLDAISVLLNLFRGQNTWIEPMAGWRVIPDSRAGTPPGCGIPRSYVSK